MSSSDNEWVVIPLDPQSFSDGDPAAWPKGPQFRRVNDELYRHKVAMMWLQKQGRLEKGGLDLYKINFLLFMLSLFSYFISIFFLKKYCFWHYIPYDISDLQGVCVFPKDLFRAYCYIVLSMLQVFNLDCLCRYCETRCHLLGTC